MSASPVPSDVVKVASYVGVSRDSLEVALLSRRGVRKSTRFKLSVAWIVAGGAVCGIVSDLVSWLIH